MLSSTQSIPLKPKVEEKKNDIIYIDNLVFQIPEKLDTLQEQGLADDITVFDEWLVF